MLAMGHMLGTVVGPGPYLDAWLNYGKRPWQLAPLLAGSPAYLPGPQPNLDTGPAPKLDPGP